MNCFQAKEKERRLKLREEKIEQQRIHQEERVKKALERAKAEPKKQVCFFNQSFMSMGILCIITLLLEKSPIPIPKLRVFLLM